MRKVGEQQAVVGQAVAEDGQELQRDGGHPHRGRQIGRRLALRVCVRAERTQR